MGLASAATRHLSPVIATSPLGIVCEDAEKNEKRAHLRTFCQTYRSGGRQSHWGFLSQGTCIAGSTEGVL